MDSYSVVSGLAQIDIVDYVRIRIGDREIDNQCTQGVCKKHMLVYTFKSGCCGALPISECPCCGEKLKK